jgi:hypothetical protein
MDHTYPVKQQSPSLPEADGQAVVEVFRPVCGVGHGLCERQLVEAQRLLGPRGRFVGHERLLQLLNVILPSANTIDASNSTSMDGWSGSIDQLID